MNQNGRGALRVRGAAADPVFREACSAKRAERSALSVPHFET
ncbi:Uncharacterised protein [Mycobacteroides abscessus subsp. abscessus]|nr:Uncharacterised protein [Mycobacteroides abscessus subsp. abscessus]